MSKRGIVDHCHFHVRGETHFPAGASWQSMLLQQPAPLDLNNQQHRCYALALRPTCVLFDTALRVRAGLAVDILKAVSMGDGGHLQMPRTPDSAISAIFDDAPLMAQLALTYDSRMCSLQTHARVREPRSQTNSSGHPMRTPSIDLAMLDPFRPQQYRARRS